MKEGVDRLERLELFELITPFRTWERTMADFEYVACPKCHDKFMAGEEFFRLPNAYCHCPYCGNEFPVGVAAGETSRATDKSAR